LSRVLSRGHQAESLWRRSIVREMCAEFVGLLRWQRLLALQTDPPPGARSNSYDANDWLVALVDQVDTDVAYEQQAETVNQWADIVSTHLKNEAAQVTHVELAQLDFTIDTALAPFVSLDGANDLSAMEAPIELRQAVVARCDIDIGDGRLFDPRGPGQDGEF